MTSKEVVEFLGISRMRLSQLSREGKITPIREGIYLRDDIEAFQKKRQKKEG